MNVRDSSQTILDRTYDEALALVVEARNYIASGRPRDEAGDDPAAKLLVSQETMRVTSRLTQVMAWLFCQRAVLNGEMSRDEALSARFSLGGHTVCQEDRWHDDERLPSGLRSLQQRSLNLFSRIYRLEEMQRQSTLPPTGTS